MDSLTQIVLGAAVGEAVMGKKVGNKAALWGAIAGTIPDLDVLFSPFMSELSGLVFHRSFTHSMFFGIIFGPLLGWLIYKKAWFYGKLYGLYLKGMSFLNKAGFKPSFIQKITKLVKEPKVYEEKQSTLRDWQWLAFWGLFTHPILDCFTNWGTQFFYPFSNYRVAFNTICVVDPIYTLPFAFFLVIALFLRKENAWRSRWNTTGLVLSSMIMGLTCINKMSAEAAFRTTLRDQGSSVQRMTTQVFPLNLLWYCVAEEPSGYRIGYYSLFSNPKDICYQYISKNHFIADKYKNPETMETLKWFSNGYYSLEEKKDTLLFHDLRFGLINLEDTTQKPPLYAFNILLPNKEGADIHQQEPPKVEMDLVKKALRILWDKSWHKKSFCNGGK